MKNNKLITSIIFTAVIVPALFAYHSSRRQPAPDDACSFCAQVIPDGRGFMRLKRFPGFAVYRFSDHTQKNELLGYAFRSSEIVNQSQGFNGPIDIAVGVNPQGKLVGINVLQHSETNGYVDDLKQFTQQFIAKIPDSPLQIGQDIDGMTGATITSRSIARIIKESLLAFQKNVLNQSGSATKTEYPSLPQLRTVTPTGEQRDLISIKNRLNKSGLQPQEAKYWEKFQQE